jgi:putative glutamine amidotransferase
VSVVVGVTLGHLQVGQRWVDGADTDYSRAVVAAGGVPVLIPGDPSAAEVVGRVDALLLSGGGDVDPARYGEKASSLCGGIDTERDRAELAVVGAALDASLPVLGICRGLQLLNVALGGSLQQHILGVTDIPHLTFSPRHHLAHEVRLEPDSQLATVMGGECVEVNSIHHQAIERLARCLRPVGYAHDGLIEAVEWPGKPVLAVQWHPENLTDRPQHLALFRWLTRAAGGQR